MGALRFFSPLRIETPTCFLWCPSNTCNSVAFQLGAKAVESVLWKKDDYFFLEKLSFGWSFCPQPKLSFSRKKNRLFFTILTQQPSLLDEKRHYYMGLKGRENTWVFRSSEVRRNPRASFLAIASFHDGAFSNSPVFSLGEIYHMLWVVAFVPACLHKNR